METEEDVGCRFCKKVAKFNCQSCNYILCRTCKNRHLKYRDIDDHYVVQLKDVKKELMEERCPTHRGKLMELFCKKCIIPVCSSCVTEKHNGHVFGDFSAIYSTALDFLKQKILTIKKDLLPKCQSSLQALQKKEHTIQNQIAKLTDTVNEYEKQLNGDPSDVISFYKACKTEDKELSLPEIKKNEQDKTMFQKLYKSTQLDQYIRLAAAAQSGLTGRSNHASPRPGYLEEGDNSAVNNEIKVPVVKSAHHISCTQDGNVWVSDNVGNLVLMDMSGNSLVKLATNGGDEGFHSVTSKGELIFTDKVNKCVKRLNNHNDVDTILKTGHWKPTCVFSSPKNLDIFVGMVSDQYAKVGRFDKKGKALMDIHSDSQGRALLKYPLYLAENINSDICVSDVNKHAVIVLDKLGRHRFTYKGDSGDNGGFWPHGISTDDQGHILVCNSYFSNPSVQMLDENGVFLFIILAKKHGLQKPRSLCVDSHQRLWVGQWHENKVCVYKITI